jgi:carboxylesterase type B
MVFFYGGNFKQGGSSTRLYNGDFLANNTDVITVVLNYRVGALSFFINNAVTGNLAIQDQAYALMVG